MRRPTLRIGHCQNFDARSSCLSGSGTRALFEVIMATFRWMKSLKNGDLYNPGLPGGTTHPGVSKFLPPLPAKRGVGNGWQLTTLVVMRFNIPVCVDIRRLILLDTSRFDLFETPLREIDISSSQVATQDGVPKPEGCAESTDSRSVFRSNVVDYFNLPMIFIISNGDISITRHFVMRFRDRGGNGM